MLLASHRFPGKMPALSRKRTSGPLFKIHPFLQDLTPCKAAWILARAGAGLRFCTRPNKFGNALGEFLAGQLSAAQRETQLQQQEDARDDALANAFGAKPSNPNAPTSTFVSYDGSEKRNISGIADEYGLSFTSRKSQFGSGEKLFKDAADTFEQKGIALQKLLDSTPENLITGKFKDTRFDPARLGGAIAGVIDVFRPVGTVIDYSQAFSNHNIASAILGDDGARQFINDANKHSFKILTDIVGGAANFIENGSLDSVRNQIGQLVENLDSASPELRANASRTVTALVLGVALGGEGGANAIAGALARLGGLTTDTLGAAATGFRTRVRSFLERNPDSVSPANLDKILPESTIDSEALRF
ncbi:MAG: hypothetical protein RL748_2667, partial [Pseudomonadota bacterium]